VRYDFVVLGSGPAGRRAAVQAAKLGKSVLVIDNRDRVGGVSVHTGTIPSKTLRETVLNLSGWRERGFYGRSYRVKREIDGSDLSARLGKTLTHEIEVLEHQFARNGVRTLSGTGRFVDPSRIAVTRGGDGREQIFEADRVLIAVGTQPFRPPGVPFDGEVVLDSDEFIRNPRVPRSLTVVGAGVIGLEYATIFAAPWSNRAPDCSNSWTRKWLSIWFITCAIGACACCWAGKPNGSRSTRVRRCANWRMDARYAPICFCIPLVAKARPPR
jgi:NAD(P) transhydrogenase